MSNELLGFLVVSLTGTLAYFLRSLPTYLWNFLVSQCTITVSISNTSTVYSDVLEWLAEPHVLGKSRTLQLGNSSKQSHSSAKEEDLWALMPGMGRHIIWRGLRTILVTRQRDEGNKSSIIVPEIVTLRTLGRDRSYFEKLFQEIAKSKKDLNVVAIYSWQGWWRRVGWRKLRPVNSVVTRENVLESLVKDFKQFESNKDWYISRGVPYRRGYLLYGPPGTGKTSVVQALAGELARNIAVINLNDVETDKDLVEAVIGAPKDCIVLMEDIDCAVSPSVVTRNDDSEETSETATKKSFSLAGLLNVLDGALTPEGRVFMMTTNHPESLDEALLRPGRADVRVELGRVGPEEVAKMAKMFYGDVKLPSLPTEPLLPAEIQDAFMRYPEEPVKAFELLQPRTEGPWR